MRLVIRGVLFVVLLAALVGLGVHYAATYEDRWTYPTETELEESPEAYVDDDVLIFGTVTDVDAEAEELTLEAETDDGVTVEFVADEIPTEDETPAVEEGGFVQVYGTLESADELTTTETVVVNPDALAEWYKLSVSGIGVLLAMAYFLYHWRPTTAGWEAKHG